MNQYPIRMLPPQPEDLTVCNICKTKDFVNDGEYPPLCDACLKFVCSSFEDSED